MLWASVVISSVGPMVMNRDPRNKQINDQMGSVDGFLISKKVPKKLRRQIRLYMQHYYATADVTKEAELMAILPNNLLVTLMDIMRVDKLRRTFKLFASITEQQVALGLCMHLRPYFVRKHEPVYGKGELAREVFLVSSGQIFLFDSAPPGRLYEGRVTAPFI